jgi:hypothetical protein
LFFVYDFACTLKGFEGFTAVIIQKASNPGPEKYTVMTHTELEEEK